MADEMTGINERIGQVAESWATRFIEVRIGVLRKRKIEGSGDLIDSLQHAVSTNAEGVAAQMLIAFEGYGRIAEMKRVSQDAWGRNALQRVEDWITAKGIGKFMPGFLARRGLKTAPQNALNQMAWGIMVNRSNNKFRRKPWYNKAKTASISDLYNQVAVATADETLTLLRSAFDFKGYAKAKGRT